MRLQTLHLFVPAIALSVVGFALVGPGAAAPFSGAQIWGGPVERAATLSLRVSVTDRLQGIDSPRAACDFEVQARADDGRSASQRARTLTDGAADLDVPLSSPGHGRMRATVLTLGRAAPLASGFLARVGAEWGSEPRGARLAGHAEGELSLRVAAARGVFAAPFPDQLVIEVHRSGGLVSGATVSVKADGAELSATGAPLSLGGAEAGTATAVATGRTGDDGR